MSPVKVKPPRLALKPVKMPDGSRPVSWIEAEPMDWNVLVIKCNRPGAPDRPGFPKGGYLLRVWMTGNHEMADTWHVPSRARAVQVAEHLMEDPFCIPDARLMMPCINEDCAHYDVGSVPHVWDEEVIDFVCVKCKESWK